MSDGPRSPAGPAPASPTSSPASAPRHAAPVEYEFSEAHKETFRALAASVSFVGVCTMLFGAMAVLFGLGAVYAGYAPNGVGLGVGALLLLVMAWWTVSAGRSLSALVSTRGRDVERLMEAVEQLRRLFGFARVAIIGVSLVLVVVAGAIVWCTLAADKGGKCLFW
jgi:hypothetical protein